MPRGIPSLTQAQKQEIIKRVKDKGECPSIPHPD